MLQRIKIHEFARNLHFESEKLFILAKRHKI